MLLLCDDEILPLSYSVKMLHFSVEDGPVFHEMNKTVESTSVHPVQKNWLQTVGKMPSANA